MATPDITVDALVAAQAARTPDAVAVEAEGTRLTYRELDARAGRLARELAGHGVGHESVVAVALPRSADLVVALLAVLKAGGAYLPVDPRYPSRRLTAILDEARPLLVLTDSATVAALPEHTAPDVLLDALDLSGTGPAPRSRTTPSSSRTSCTPPAPRASPRASPSPTPAWSTACCGSPTGWAWRRASGSWRAPR